MERRLIFGERMMHVDMHTHINCVFAVRVSGMITAESLKAALGRIQQRHPLLQAGIHEDKKGVPFFVPRFPLPPIPIRRQVRVGDNDWKTESAREWELPFDKGTGPLARVVWLEADGQCDLLLTCPHCVVDGSSCVTLMRELLLLLDGQEPAMEPYQTFKKVADLIPQPFPRKRVVALKAGIFAAILPVFLGFSRKILLGPEDGRYFINWHVTADVAALLSERCRKEKASVYTACAVAFCEAYKEVLGEEAKGKVICPVDIRKFLPAVRAGELFAFAPIAEVNTASAEIRKMGFWQKAHWVKQKLTVDIGKLNVPELMLMSEFFHSAARKMVQLLMRKKGSHDATFSNMGKLELPEDFRNFKLEAVYSPTVSFPWKNPSTLVLSSYKGGMNFSLTSNQHHLSEKDALMISERTVDLLRQAVCLAG